MPAFIVALLLVAHGLVHATFLSPAPPAKPGAPAWPFNLDASWALTPLGLEPGVIRLVGTALVAVTVTGYAAAAVAYLGFAPASWFTPGIVMGSLASLGMLVLFFNPWFLFGFVIDAILLWAVLLNGWGPASRL